MVPTPARGNQKNASAWEPEKGVTLARHEWFPRQRVGTRKKEPFKYKYLYIYV
jgi:hypothetical protein